MRNSYPATCYRCGEEVAAFEGHFERMEPLRAMALGVPSHRQGDKWLCQHATCATKWRGTNVSVWRDRPEPDAIDRFVEARRSEDGISDVDAERILFGDKAADGLGILKAFRREKSRPAAEARKAETKRRKAEAHAELMAKQQAAAAKRRAEREGWA